MSVTTIFISQLAREQCPPSQLGEIAIQLHLSSHTIHTHVKKIDRQLKVPSRGELRSLLLGVTES